MNNKEYTERLNKVALIQMKNFKEATSRCS